MLRLPLSQAQVVQKNCSGLILEALQIHTAGVSAYSLLFKKLGFLDVFVNGGMGLSIEALLFVGWRGCLSC